MLEGHLEIAPFREIRRNSGPFVAAMALKQGGGVGLRNFLGEEKEGTLEG